MYVEDRRVVFKGNFEISQGPDVVVIKWKVS